MGTAIGYSDEVEKKNPEMIFTDRDVARKKFWKIYDELPRNGFYVINYHGFGGIGKSWLCKYLHDILKGHQHPYTGRKIDSKSLILNFEELKENCDKINVLKYLTNKFTSECGYSFPIFKYGLYVYYRTQGFSNSSPEISKIQDNEIVNVILEWSDKVPVVGEIGAKVIKSVDSVASKIRELIIKNNDIIKKLDSMSTEDIANELVTIFGKELYAYTVKEMQPLVIFMDTYEQLQNYVYQISSGKVSEEWLWSQKGLIRRIPNVIWVLTGQRQVTWGSIEDYWMDPENILYEEIKEIKEESLIKELFHNLGVEEDDIIDKIIEKTKGVPFHMALCKDTYFNLKKENIQPKVEDFDMDYPTLAKRLVGGLNSQLKDVVDILACLENWKQEDIYRLRLTSDDYEYIKQLSFVSFNDGFYYMHNSVQEIVYKNSSDIIRERCLQYFKERLQDAAVTESEKKSLIYKKIKLELLKAEEVQDEELRIKAYAELLNEYVSIIRDNIYDYNFFERMRNIIQEKIPEIYIGSYYEKLLNIYTVYHAALNGEFTAVKHYLQNKKLVEGHSKMDEDTRFLLYSSVAKYEGNQGNYYDEKNYLLEAYQLTGISGDCEKARELLASLARNALKLKHYKEAIRYCDLGLKINEGGRRDTRVSTAHCEYYVSKAKVERQYGNYKKALELLKDAEAVIEEFVEIKNEQILFEQAVIYQQYFNVYGDVERYDLRKEYARKVLDVLEETYEINASQKNYKGLAIAYMDFARSGISKDEAKANFDRAIEMFERIYQNQTNSNTLNDWFDTVRRAVRYIKVEDAKQYLIQCETIINTYGVTSIKWDKQYLYHREWYLYYDSVEDSLAKEEAERLEIRKLKLDKLDEIEQILEVRKERLSEEDYLAYKSWNRKRKGFICLDDEDIYGAISWFEKENILEYKLYTSAPNYADGVTYADSCRRLANCYERVRLYHKAVRYAKMQLKIQKALLDEFQSFQTMKEYIGALQILVNIYESNKDEVAILKTYGEILQYQKILYDDQKDFQCLKRIISTLFSIEKYKVKRGEHKQLLAMYTAVSEEISRRFSLEQNGDKDYLEVRELIKCKMACLCYLLRINMDEAREVLLHASCTYSDFRERDRVYYLGLIEKEILARYVKIRRLTKEEGIALLTSKEEGIENQICM